MTGGANQDDSFEGSEAGRRVFGSAIRLLEHNPSPLTPWLTVQSAQDEIAILQVREESEFVDEDGGEVVRG